MTGLLLAGTLEARQICDQLAEKQVAAIASLAGATRVPEKLALETRVGGFGGVDGFQSYLQDQNIKWVIDATHPFAVRMTETAAQVCRNLSIPYLILQRPEWQASQADQWHMIDDPQELEALTKSGQTLFLGTGRQTLPDYAFLSGRKILCRVIDEPEGSFPFEGGEYLVGRPPFNVQEEVETLRSRGIDWLVVKNSGGSGGISKLLAARSLGLPVAMLKRQSLPDATVVNDVQGAMDWLTGVLS